MRIEIIAQNPLVQKLLELLAVQLPEPLENIVLLDAVWMERMAEFSGEKVILFAASADPFCLKAAKEAGADGFWYVTPSAQDLAQVLEGSPAFPEKAPAVQLGKAMSGDLTARELEVLRELTAGKPDGEIAKMLSIAIPTVKHHIQQLLLKTGFSNRTQLALEAVFCGLIDKKSQ